MTHLSSEWKRFDLGITNDGSINYHKRVLAVIGE